MPYWQERGIFRTEAGLADTAYDRMISCSGKVEFRTRKEALIAVREHDETARQQAYRCRHCPYWHIGHRHR